MIEGATSGLRPALQSRNSVRQTAGCRACRARARSRSQRQKSSPHTFEITDKLQLKVNVRRWMAQRCGIGIAVLPLAFFATSPRCVVAMEAGASFTTAFAVVAVIQRSAEYPKDRLGDLRRRRLAGNRKARLAVGTPLLEQGKSK